MSEDTKKDSTTSTSVEDTYIDFSESEKLLNSLGYESFDEMSKEELVNVIHKFIEHSKKVNYELNTVISEKNRLDTVLNDTIRHVAKWENEKNVMLGIMKTENEKIETSLIENVVEILDTIESFEGLAEDIDKLIKPTVERIINKFGLQIIETKIFDPQKHMAVDKISEGTEIYKCIKKGYSYKNKIIRFASVILN